MSPFVSFFFMLITFGSILAEILGLWEIKESKKAHLILKS